VAASTERRSVAVAPTPVADGFDAAQPTSAERLNTKKNVRWIKGCPPCSSIIDLEGIESNDFLDAPRSFHQDQAP
jgi:hypothetical protein